MTAQQIVSSKKFKIAAGICGVVILMALSFAVGLQTGLHKARFSFAWGENYERNFTGMHPQMGPKMVPGPGFPERMGEMKDRFEGREFRNAHGLAGAIISISENNIVIKDRDNKENTVSVNDKTLIKSGRDDIKITDLKQDDKIVVMGKPGDNGTVNADLIRVFDNGIR
jgi:hypothetical protein